MPRNNDPETRESDLAETHESQPDVPASWQPSDDMLREFEEPQDTPTTSEWTDTGIQDVAVDRIDVSDSYVTSDADFKKVSREEMQEGFRLLETEVKPRVAAGDGPDDFTQSDNEKGLDYEHGSRRIYDAFYGDSAIRLTRDGDTYDVTNGYHRLSVAREMGLESVPARVIERRKK